MIRKFADKINKKLKSDEEEITFKSYDEEAERRAAAPEVTLGSVLKADETKDSSIKFKVMKPESFDEVSKIADQLIEGCTVLFNAELIDRDTRQRMLLFLNGVTYTTDGEIRPVSQNTYIITPHDVDVSDEV
ncbi:MAG: cell division protein SepF [Clostridia bacterium]|nr:cell division protein SepF [Clostridia bacterium]